MNCNDCKVREVCEHVCGGLWLLYSHGAIGCDKPDGMEKISTAWEKSGWRPSPKQPFGNGSFSQDSRKEIATVRAQTLPFLHTYN